MRVLYLHGFASSPASSKAEYLAARLAPLGVALERPDLNVPDFSTLTVARMISQVEDALGADAACPVVLVGSSLGGFVAWHVAARAEAAGRPLDRLVLLAPALDFGRRDLALEPDEGLRRWRERGWWECDHHAYGERRRVHYALYGDAGRYDTENAVVSAPALVFQGRRDEVVRPEVVAAFAARRPTIELHLLDDDHQLAGSLETIWRETARFLGLSVGLPHVAPGRGIRSPGEAPGAEGSA